MKIGYIPNDFDAPGCYRCLFPARHLRELGHDVRMPPWTEEDLPNGRYRIKFDTDLVLPNPLPDVYVLQQRKERMWAEGGMGRLRKLGVATVCDVDDNYEELEDTNPAWVGTHPYRRDDGVILNRSARRRAQKILGQKIGVNPYNRTYMHRVFEQADALTVSTPYLAEVYSKYNKRIYVLRNLLEWEIWDDITPQYEVERERVRVGYLASYVFRQASDVNILKPWLRDFLLKRPEVDFVANSEAMHDALGVPLEQRIVVDEYAFRPRDGGNYPVGEKTAVIDIGLVPLTLNGLNKGKSHLKGMEYNAAGVPFIASPTESYTDYWCDEGENGFIARNDKEWIESLDMLVTDDKKRRQMGKLGRLKASEHTFQKRIGEWEDVYKKIYGDQYTLLARDAIRLNAVQKVTELEQMLRYAASVKPRVTVEVGSAAGGTFWTLARVTDPMGLLVSIDIPAGSVADVRQGRDVYQGRNRNRMRTYGLPGQRVRLIDGNSQLDETRAALEYVLEGRKIDVLFIDADHSYKGVKRDFELYSPLVRSGGLIFFHDILIQNNRYSQVDVFWKELKKQYPNNWSEFVGHDQWGVPGQWGGIGMLRVP